MEVRRLLWIILLHMYWCSAHVIGSPWGRMPSQLGKYVVENKGTYWFLCSYAEGEFPDIVLSCKIANWYAVEVHHSFTHSSIHSLLINLFLIIGTNRYFSKVVATQMGIEITFVDASDLSKLKNGIKPNTKVCSELFNKLNFNTSFSLFKDPPCKVVPQNHFYFFRRPTLVLKGQCPDYAHAQESSVFSSKDNRTVKLTRQDFLPDRTADRDLLFIFSSNILDFRRSLLSYIKIWLPVRRLIAILSLAGPPRYAKISFRLL